MTMITVASTTVAAGPIRKHTTMRPTSPMPTITASCMPRGPPPPRGGAARRLGRLRPFGAEVVEDHVVPHSAPSLVQIGLDPAFVTEIREVVGLAAPPPRPRPRGPPAPPVQASRSSSSSSAENPFCAVGGSLQWGRSDSMVASSSAPSSGSASDAYGSGDVDGPASRSSSSSSSGAAHTRMSSTSSLAVGEVASSRSSSSGSGPTAGTDAVVGRSRSSRSGTPGGRVSSWGSGSGPAASSGGGSSAEITGMAPNVLGSSAGGGSADDSGSVGGTVGCSPVTGSAPTIRMRPEGRGSCGVSPGSVGSSLIEQLFFLVRQRPVEGRLVGVGHVVELLLGPLQVVRPEIAVLLHALELVAGGPAQVAEGDLALLRHVPDQLHQLAHPLLGQRWEGEAHDMAVVGGVEAEVGLADRLLDGVHRALVERSDDQEPGLGHGEVRQLLQGHLGAVVVDRELLDQARVGPSGADGGELVAGVGHGLVHLLAGVVEDQFEQVPVVAAGHRARSQGKPGQETRVQIGLPSRMDRMLPGPSRSKTTIGTALSMHSVMAVESMARSPRSRTSM